MQRWFCKQVCSFLVLVNSSFNKFITVSFISIIFPNLNTDLFWITSLRSSSLKRSKVNFLKSTKSDEVSLISAVGSSESSSHMFRNQSITYKLSKRTRKSIFINTKSLSEDLLESIFVACKLLLFPSSKDEHNVIKDRFRLVNIISNCNVCKLVNDFFHSFIIRIVM